MADTVAQTPAEIPVAKPRVKKPKHSFMLHDPLTFASLGKFVSTDFRYSALKVASRGHNKILLSKTNIKVIYEYSGDVLELDTPQIVKRGEREIRYTRKPVVKFVKKYVYEGDIAPDSDADDTVVASTQAAV